MRKFTSCETVEIPVNNASNTKFYFPELPNLRDKVIERVDAYYSNLVSKSPQNRDVIDDDTYYNSYLVLVSDGNEVINRIPLIYLWKLRTTMNLFPLNLIIDFPKSYVEVAKSSTITDSMSFLFTFYFNEPDFIVPINSGAKMKIENMEVEITDTSRTKFYFPDNENLRNKIIRKIDASSSAYQTYAPSGKTITSKRDHSFLVLVSKNKEIVNRIPIYMLDSNVYIGSLLTFNNIQVDFPKSYIEYPNPSDLTAGEVYFLNFLFFEGEESSMMHRQRIRRHPHPRHRTFRHL